MTIGRSMHSNAEYYRRRGIVAKQRAAQIADLSLKETFKDVARHWLALAERIDWLDRQHNGSKTRLQTAGKCKREEDWGR
jgi:hypothetical protein